MARSGIDAIGDTADVAGDTGDRTAIALLKKISTNTGAAGPGGGLTDAELRATPVDVNVENIPHVIVDSMPAGGAGLTDLELRATPVSVSGTVTVTEPVSVDDNGGSLTVDGPLTDAQLRAVPVPVSGTVTASGPLTDTQLRASAVPVTIPVPAPISDNGGSITVDGPVTDAQLRATPVPVSGAVTVASTAITATVTPAGDDVVADGRDVVTTAGTRVQMQAQACKVVAVTAETDNTGLIVIGGATVVAAIATRRGLPLSAGDSATFTVDNTNRLFIDATVSTDGVTWAILS